MATAQETAQRVLEEMVAYVGSPSEADVEPYPRYGSWVWTDQGEAKFEAIAAKLPEGWYIVLGKGHMWDMEPGIDYTGHVWVSDDYRCDGGCCDMAW